MNAGDSDAFLAFFPEHGVVDDWGRRFVGRDAIRSWSDNEFIGAQGQMTVKHVSHTGNEVTVTADWVSNHYSGPSRFTFLLDGGQVQEMRITSA